MGLNKWRPEFVVDTSAMSAMFRILKTDDYYDENNNNNNK